MGEGARPPGGWQLPRAAGLPLLALAAVGALFLTALSVGAMWMPAIGLAAHTGTPAGYAAARALLSAAGGSRRRATAELRSSLDRLRRGETRLIFYHVHKSAGSSLCHALVQEEAPLMGCVDAHKDKVLADRKNAWCNCNGHTDLVPTPIATEAPAAVERYLRARKPQAFFNEDGVADEPYWGPLAVHLIIVRDPIQRYISHMLHVLTKEDGRTLRDINVSAEALRHHARPYGDGGGIVDNYLTRYLAGWTVLGRPTKAGVWGVAHPPPLTSTHFLAALQNLERMQVVLVLEDIDGAAGLLRALRLPPFAPSTRAGTAFSLAAAPGGGGGAGAGAAGNGTAGGHQLSEAALRHLRELHQWDQMLYEWARHKHSRTLEAFAALGTA